LDCKNWIGKLIIITFVRIVLFEIDLIKILIHMIPWLIIISLKSFIKKIKLVLLNVENNQNRHFSFKKKELHKIGNYAKIT
jgi:uncharacterized membrane protein YkvI